METMEMSEQIDKLASALAQAQGELEGVRKTAENPHLRNRYADLGDVWDAVRKPLSSHGLSVIQIPLAAQAGFVAVRTLLCHASGQWVGGVATIPFEPAKGLNPAQTVGSALTYLRRYALSAIVGVAPEDDDASTA